MKRLQKKSLSAREAAFALANCVCACSCTHPGCQCPIAPTHQEGINAQSDENKKLYTAAYSAAMSKDQKNNESILV